MSDGQQIQRTKHESNTDKRGKKGMDTRRQRYLVKNTMEEPKKKNSEKETDDNCAHENEK